ncbi:MAG: nicotinate-nucleotide adenylyltransferase [Alphaproteobacteria bacterium]|jgi:nicotinate-nucleotide adenylyltransferase|nr:nicotinate-nucleotide adenylyltransferase [Alphaproteobacteria bacterium]
MTRPYAPDHAEIDDPMPRAARRPIRRIGLLGGSFNPAHGGHRQISVMALQRLGLDEVWWLVSPQNPLKTADGMDSFEQRFERAAALARHPRIRVSELEVRLATRYTVDTLAALRRLYPDLAFVWMMGADNLVQLPEWQGWLEIVGSVPVAVFARPTYSLRALAGKAARRFARARLPEAAARGLVDCEPPAWVFLHTRLNPISATEIRRERRTGE